MANRMIHDGRYKLIYYPCGNRLQLFDLETDARESNDLGRDAAHKSVRERLLGRLMEELYADDLRWVQGGELVALPG